MSSPSGSGSPRGRKPTGSRSDPASRLIPDPGEGELGGGVAADRTAVPILLGLGVRELSVVPAVIPELKSQIGSLRIADCEKLAQSCLRLGSAAEVRGMVERFAGDGGYKS